MLYLPKRSLFIHIPRTGGNAVTSVVATVAAGRGVDCVVATQPWMLGWPFHRHASLAEVELFIPDLFELYIWTIDRPLNDRVASYLRLVEFDRARGVHEDPTCSDSWRQTLLADDEQVKAAFGRFETRHYTLSFRGAAVDVVPYAELSSRWPELAARMGLPANTVLPRV